MNAGRFGALPRRSAALLATVTAIAAMPATESELGFSRSITPELVQRDAALFGSGVPVRLHAWQDFVQRIHSQPPSGREMSNEVALLAPVNQFFNRTPPISDRELWHVDDYWATPAEMLSANGGDCEDYAIAKYFALKELGVPVAKLRLVYARTWYAANEAHMVLAYYDSPDADPLILDNLDGVISSAASRPDLTPVYTFNDEDMMLLQKNAPALHLPTASNRKWQSLIDKLRREVTA